MRRLEIALVFNAYGFLDHTGWRYQNVALPREIDDLASVAHFEIELRHQARAQANDVAILNMPPIRPQMHGDTVAASALAHARSGEQIGLSVGGVEHPGIAYLPERGDVVDVDA